MNQKANLTKRHNPDNPNSGHGHIYPRPDGIRARCGGWGYCSDCAADKREKEARELAKNQKVWRAVGL